MVHIRNKKKQILILLFFIFTVVTFIFLGLDKKSYAFDYESNYMKDYVLNPAWVEYMELSNEEKSYYEIIPEKFIYRYKKVKSPISLFSSKSI